MGWIRIDFYMKFISYWDGINNIDDFYFFIDLVVYVGNVIFMFF